MTSCYRHSLSGLLRCLRDDPGEPVSPLKSRFEGEHAALSSFSLPRTSLCLTSFFLLLHLFLQLDHWDYLPIFILLPACWHRRPTVYLCIILLYYYSWMIEWGLILVSSHRSANSCQDVICFLKPLGIILTNNEFSIYSKWHASFFFLPPITYFHPFASKNKRVDHKQHTSS